MEQDVTGFNSNLSCCNEYWSVRSREQPGVRGAYMHHEQSRVRPGPRGQGRRNEDDADLHIKKNAYWTWGSKKLPVTYRDFVYTWKAFTNPKNDVVSP